MVTYQHEMALTILRDHPNSGPALAERLLGLKQPTVTSAEPTSEALTTTYPPELNCDGAQLLYNHEGEIVSGLIIEVQLEHDEDKTYTWFAYLANLRRRIKRPARLIVICPLQRVATKAREEIAIGHRDISFAPHVLGPDNIPQVVEPVKGPDSLLLTFLSALIHTDSDVCEDIGGNLDDEFGRLPVDQAVEYSKCAFNTFGEPMLMVMEALMQTEKYDYHRALLGESADKYLAEGEARGRAEGQAEVLFTIIESRNLTLTDAQRAQINECRDSELLNTWVAQALNATGADDIFQLQLTYY